MTLAVTRSSTLRSFPARLILLAAFIKFIRHNAYGYNGPERWLFLLLYQARSDCSAASLTSSLASKAISLAFKECAPLWLAPPELARLSSPREVRYSPLARAGGDAPGERGRGAGIARRSQNAVISRNGVSPDMLSRSRRDLIYDLLAPPLILTTPFASFVNYNDYGFARTEIWLVLGGLIALGLLCGVVMTLGGQWARIILTAGLLTLFVDFQFDWLDKQPEFRVPAFGIGMLLLSWLLRAQLSRITTPVFATMLVAT